MKLTQVRRWGLPILVIVVLGGVASTLFSARDPQTPAGGRREATHTVARRDFVKSVRLSGTVEAVESTTIAAPRIAGPNSASLVITRLVKAGTTVRPGDLLVEFDRQAQLSNALDRRAELNDLEQQIRKREAEEAAARARDDSEMQPGAERGLPRRPRDGQERDAAEDPGGEEHARRWSRRRRGSSSSGRHSSSSARPPRADLRILEIRRDKASSAMKMAETNASRMEVRSPIAGLAVIRTMWKSNGMAEILEGEEVRAGVPVVDIVNPAKMRVRVRVNQADINDLRVGQRMRVGLDAYPDLYFGGRITQISPLAVTSTLSPKLRYFMMLAEIDSAHAKLMPDLTASLDVELSRTAGRDRHSP